MDEEHWRRWFDFPGPADPSEHSESGPHVRYAWVRGGR